METLPLAFFFFLFFSLHTCLTLVTTLQNSWHQNWNIYASILSFTAATFVTAIIRNATHHQINTVNNSHIGFNTFGRIFFFPSFFKKSAG